MITTTTFFVRSNLRIINNLFNVTSTLTNDAAYFISEVTNDNILTNMRNIKEVFHRTHWVFKRGLKCGEHKQNYCNVGQSRTSLLHCGKHYVGQFKTSLLQPGIGQFKTFQLHCGKRNVGQFKTSRLHCGELDFYRNICTSTPVTMAIRLFEGKEHAELYAQFRPTYPAALFETIVNFYKEGKGERCNFDLAVDVGCGNGQSSRPFCKFFKRVIGSDVSAEQIASANKNHFDNLSFVVNPGEDLSFLENESVDLLTISQALHWLDQPKFYGEVTRVLKPGGVYAAIGYGLNRLENQRGNDVMWQFYNDLLGSYWDENRSHVDRHYAGFELPFPDWKRIELPTLAIQRTLTVDDYVGYLTTFSAWRKYDKEHPNSGHIELLKKSFREVYGDSGEPVIDVTWPTFILIGRKLT